MWGPEGHGKIHKSSVGFKLQPKWPSLFAPLLNENNGTYPIQHYGENRDNPHAHRDLTTDPWKRHRLTLLSLGRTGAPLLCSATDHQGGDL